MKTSTLSVIAFLLLAASQGIASDKPQLAAEDPIVIATPARMKLILERLKTKEDIELLLGKGVPDGGKTAYKIRLPGDLSFAPTKPVVEGILITYANDSVSEIQCFLKGFSDTQWSPYFEKRPQPNQSVQPTR